LQIITRDVQLLTACDTNSPDRANAIQSKKEVTTMESILSLQTYAVAARPVASISSIFSVNCCNGSGKTLAV